MNSESGRCNTWRSHFREIRPELNSLYLFYETITQRTDFKIFSSLLPKIAYYQPLRPTWKRLWMDSILFLMVLESMLFRYNNRFYLMALSWKSDMNKISFKERRDLTMMVFCQKPVNFKEWFVVRFSSFDFTDGKVREIEERVTQAKMGRKHFHLETWFKNITTAENGVQHNKSQSITTHDIFEIKFMSFYGKKVEREKKDKNHQLRIFQDCKLRKKNFFAFLLGCRCLMVETLGRRDVISSAMSHNFQWFFCCRHLS